METSGAALHDIYILLPCVDMIQSINQSINWLLTLRGLSLQLQRLAAGLLAQGVTPVDTLWVWEAQLGIPPNIHPTPQDLCRAEDTKELIS